MTLVLLPALGAMLYGCAGQPPDVPPGDAPDAFYRPCWAGGGTPTPGAEVEIGIGHTNFEPVVTDQVVYLERGIQGGAHFELSSRIRGMFPGNPDDAIAPNPITHFSIFRESGDAIQLFPCSFPLGYREGADGFYELAFGGIIQIQSMYIPIVPGERIRLQVEVKDPEGRYAIDERWVQAALLESPDAGPADAGPADAGPADAGPADAGIDDAGPSDALLPDADTPDGG